MRYPIMNPNDVSYVVSNNKTINSNVFLLTATTSPELTVYNTTEDGISSYHPITSFIEQHIIPVICLFGLIGNTLASVVFLQKPLRGSSCSIFLAARGFSDNGFLSTLLIIWISRTFQLQLGTIRGSCMIIIYVSYVCGCISVWLMVFVTGENYIRMCRPFIVNSVCTTTVAKIIVGFICFIAICFYNFPFWAMSPDHCISYAQYHSTVQVIVYTDTVITLVVPLICTISLMSAIMCQVIKSYNRRSHLRAPSTKRVRNPMAKVTRMLLAVTITFVCLNLPSHINRLRIMISSFISHTNDQRLYSALEDAIYKITLLIYYVSLSLNILVYIIFGSRFRKVLRGMFCTMSLRRLSMTRNQSGQDQDSTPMRKILKDVDLN